MYFSFSIFYAEIKNDNGQHSAFNFVSSLFTESLPASCPVVRAFVDMSRWGGHE